jgi:Tfp pilus assembly protein PilO
MRTLISQAQWCQRAQWVLGLSLLLMVSGFFTFVYRPNSQRLSDLRDQINGKKSNLSTNKARAQILPDVLVAVNQMQSRLEMFDKKIPTRNELSEFIHDITDLSDRTGLRNRWNVEPGVPQHGDHERYAEWPISMKFEGDFLNVCAFLRRTELMDRLSRVKGLKIHSTDGGKSGNVQVELSMNIYYLEG